MHTSNLTRLLIAGGLLALVAAVFSLGGPAATAQSGSSPTPTRVATVDLVKLVNGLEQFKQSQTDSESYTNQLVTRVENAEQAMRDAAEELEIATDATREQLLEDFVTKAAQVRAEEGALEVLAFAKQNRILRETWRGIQSSIATYAEENGYDMVISSDRLVQAGSRMDANPEVYKSFMMSKRVLYNDESIDITDELITRMNVEYRASLGSGGGG